MKIDKAPASNGEVSIDPTTAAGPVLTGHRF